MRMPAPLLPIGIRALIAPALIVATATVAVAWTAATSLGPNEASDRPAGVLVALLDPDPARQHAAMAAIGAAARRNGGVTRRLTAMEVRDALGPVAADGLVSGALPAMIQLSVAPEQAASLADILRRVRDVDVEPLPQRRDQRTRRLAPLLPLVALGAAGAAGFRLVGGRAAGLLLLHRLGATPWQLIGEAAAPLVGASIAGASLAAVLMRESLPDHAEAGRIAAWAALAAAMAGLAGGAVALSGLWRARR